jgi:hypothetical protein
MPRVDRQIGALIAYKLEAIDAGRRRENAGATKLGELNGQRSDAARGSVNDDGLAALHRERLVDALQRGQLGGRDCAGVLKIEPRRDMGDLLRERHIQRTGRNSQHIDLW